MDNSCLIRNIGTAITNDGVRRRPLSSDSTEAPLNFTSQHSPGQKSKQKRWELNYEEAAIYLEEGENNDKFATHPSSQSALPAYLITHNKWVYILDLLAALLLLSLALLERPSIPYISTPVWVHGSLELLSFFVIGMELGFRMKWLGTRVFFKHIRTMIKCVLLVVMIAEAVTVVIRQTSHFRVTRALRPLFLLDCYYARNVRRFVRQIIQSLPPILEMLALLLFFMLVFSMFGFYLFSDIENDTYFGSIQQSFISLFVLLTTANSMTMWSVCTSYPDVMMPAYAASRWSALFFVCYLCLELYLLMNLFLAVVYDAFSKIEKSKLKKLLLHKRAACGYAFNLLVSKENPHSISLQHFTGLMSHYSPRKSRRDLYLDFKSMNKSETGYLTLDEFHSVYETSKIKWKPKKFMQIWSSGFLFPLNKIFKGIHRLVTWNWFEYGVYIVIFTNFVWILADTIRISVAKENDTNYQWKEEENEYLVFSIVFIVIYMVEMTLKILGLGPVKYFNSGWNVFDFLVTVAALVGVLFQLMNSTFFYVMLLRPLRVIRLFRMKRSMSDVFGTMFIVMSRMTSLAVVMILLYYFFAIIGMELFHKYDLRNCCQNTSIESFYRHYNGSEVGYYYLNNFDNILYSGVTLFELTVVNNWYIIMEGYAQVSSEWSRIYFMLFYLIIMIVMNVVVAFILESFLFRIEYRKTMHVQDMEDHAVKHVEIALTPDELNMCLRCDTPLNGQYIRQHRDFTAQSINGSTETLSVFVGERLRSKEDFSYKMYSEEVKEWLQEEEGQLRQRLDVLHREYSLLQEDTDYSPGPSTEDAGPTYSTKDACPNYTSEDAGPSCTTENEGVGNSTKNAGFSCSTENAGSGKSDENVGPSSSTENVGSGNITGNAGPGDIVVNFDLSDSVDSDLHDDTLNESLS